MKEKVFVVRNYSNKTIFVKETEFVENGTILFLHDFLTEMQFNKKIEYDFRYYNFWDYSCLVGINDTLWKHMDNLMWEYYKTFTPDYRQEMFNYLFKNADLEATCI